MWNTTSNNSLSQILLGSSTGVDRVEVAKIPCPYEIRVKVDLKYVSWFLDIYYPKRDGKVYKIMRWQVCVSPFKGAPYACGLIAS